MPKTTKRNIIMKGRKMGVSFFLNYEIEKALSEGKTVLQITPHARMKKKKVKHLTVIESEKL